MFLSERTLKGQLLQRLSEFDTKNFTPKELSKRLQMTESEVTDTLIAFNLPYRGGVPSRGRGAPKRGRGSKWPWHTLSVADWEHLTNRDIATKFEMANAETDPKKYAIAVNQVAQTRRRLNMPMDRTAKIKKDTTKSVVINFKGIRKPDERPPHPHPQKLDKKKTQMTGFRRPLDKL